ncbi:MAG: response regulator transcription factor [Saprospiraceae bacterium]
MKLLLIEDEPTLATAIAGFLEKEGFQVELAADFPTAEQKAAVYDYACIIADILLPGGGSGLDVLRNLKRKRPSAAFILISAKDSLDDRLHGLDLGADDYLTKPFHLAELNARLKALLRRRFYEGGKLLSYKEVLLDPEEQRVWVKEVEIALTRSEYQLLLYLLANKGRVLTKEMLAEALGGDDADQLDSFDFVYSHVKNLRKKLAAAGGSDHLQSVYGLGYKFGNPL